MPCSLQQVRSTFLQYVPAGIFLPIRVEYAVSSDGQRYQQAGPPVTHQISLRQEGPLTHSFVARRIDAEARFLRIHARSIGKIPTWHAAGEAKAWLFVDEIRVNPPEETAP